MVILPQFTKINYFLNKVFRKVSGTVLFLSTIVANRDMEAEAGSG